MIKLQLYLSYYFNIQKQNINFNLKINKINVFDLFINLLFNNINFLFNFQYLLTFPSKKNKLISKQIYPIISLKIFFQI